MADVGVSTGTGATIAAESIGTAFWQRVKLGDGKAASTGMVGATTGVPDATATALQVAVKPGVSVSAQVSGTVSVAPGASVIAQVSGSVTLLGSVGASIVAPVSISGITPVTTAVSVSVSGVPVWLNPTQQIVVSGLVGHSITGSVNIVSTAIVSLATGGTLATLLGTVAVNVVAGAAGGGTVNISSVTPVTTAASVSVSGLPVWLNPTQTIAVSGLVGHSITGSVNIVSTAIVSLATGGTLATLLGTVAVNVVAGGAAPGTTAATQSAISAQVVWLAPTQTLSIVSTVGTVLGTVAVNVVAGGAAPGTTAATQSAISAQVVWLAPTQTMTVNVSGTAVVTLATGGSVTLVGTVGASLIAAVSISSIVPVTTAASVSVSGLPVWLNPTQTIAVSGLVGHSITGSVNIVSTAIVSLATGGTLATLLGTVLVSQRDIVPVTTAASVSVSGLPVWLNPTQTIAVSGLVGHSITGSVNIVSTAIVSLATGGTVTLVGTVGASIVAAISISGIVPVTTAASVSVTGIPVWMNPTQRVQVSGTVDVAVATTAVATTTQASGVTGALVYLAADQTVGVTVSVSVSAVASVVPAGGYYYAVATSTAVSSSTQVLLQSVYVSTGSTAGISGWTIGSGSALAVYGLGFGWSQAAANMSATLMFLVTTSGATLSTVGVHWAELIYSNNAATSTFLSTGWVPGNLVAAHSSITTIPFPWIIPGPAVVGFAVAATSSGVTVYASINASIMPTVPFVQPVVVSGVPQVAVSGGTTVVSGTVTVGGPPVAGTNVVILVSFSAMASGATMQFTIQTGNTSVAAGTTAWAVPANKTFRIRAMQAVCQSSAVVGGIRLLVLAATATASLSVTSTVGIAAGLGAAIGGINQFNVSLENDVAAGTTIGLGAIGGTAYTLHALVVEGFLYP